MKSCESELNQWYLDDGVLAGDPSTVLQDLDKIIQASDALGLQVKPSKCELYFTKNPEAQLSADELSIKTDFEAKAPGIRVLAQDEWTLLGAPVTEAAGDSILRKKLEALKLMGQRLKDIDAHDALFLLRNCFSIPKLTYLLRTAPFYKHNELVALYDEELRTILQSILNITLEEDAWTQSSLPVAKGGLGIRLASDLSLPAFLSSAHGAGRVVESLLPEWMVEWILRMLHRSRRKLEISTVK